MGDVIRGLGQLIETLRAWFSVLLLVAAALAGVAWLVRTRRVQPFGILGKIARSACDPLIAPVERRLARFGISQANAPWWALLVLLLLGAVTLGFLGFVREVLVNTYYASSEGPRGILRLVLAAGFALLQLAIIVRVVISWVGGSYSAIGRIATTMTEWFMAPLRRVIPQIGMVDISPIVAYFAISLIRGLVLSSL